MDLTALTNASNTTNLHIGQNRLGLAHVASELSSGLRVQSAADDPSGLAISETIQEKVNGLQQGQQNVQTANNMLNVAEGHLQTVSSVLTRMRALVVEAHSDLNSKGNLLQIQTELDSLKSEINHIASSAVFNGLHLLDGSLSNAQAQPARVQEVTPEPLPDGSIGHPNVADSTGTGVPGPLCTSVTVGNNVETALCEISVVGYDPNNAVDPILGPIGGPGLYVQLTAYGADPSFGPMQQTITAIPVGAGQLNAQVVDSSGTNIVLSFTLSNLGPQDVGATQAFQTFQNTPASTGNALAVNYGGEEGAALDLSIPNIDLQQLGLSDITVAAPQVTDGVNPTAQSNSNQFSAKDAELRVDDAIQNVDSARAQIGAQTVSLENASSDAGIAIVNQTASAAAIRDANIAQSTTEFTRDQILSSLQTSVLESVNAAGKDVITLVNSIQGGPASGA